MGAIRLATSNSTDEEYGGTFPLDASDIPYDANTTVKQKIDEMLKYKSVVVTTDRSGVVLFNQLGLPTGVTMNDIYSITVVDGVAYAWAIINNPTYIKIVAITNTSTTDDRIKHIGSTQLRLNIVYKK